MPLFITRASLELIYAKVSKMLFISRDFSLLKRKRGEGPTLSLDFLVFLGAIVTLEDFPFELPLELN